MHQLTYGIRSAAQSASVSEHAIKVAVREGALSTRTLDGERVIHHDDLHAWVEVVSGAPVLV